jgi:hypothetical protein
MRRAAVSLCIVLAVSCFSARLRAAQFDPLPAEDVQRAAAAAAGALRAGKLPNPANFELAIDKAVGYRLGSSAAVIVPDQVLVAGRPPASEGLLPLAVVISRGFSCGDFRTMLPLSRAATLSVPGVSQDPAVFLLIMRSDDKGRRLEVYGSEKEPLASVPARFIRPAAASAPIALSVVSDRFLQLALTVNSRLTASVRLGPGAPEKPPPGTGGRVGERT